MIFEILGGKLLAPYFGSGIYVWTSIISATLLALAIGYYLAGKLVDRISSIRSIGIVLLLTGLSALISVNLLPVIAHLAHKIDLRWASFISSLLLIFPPLVLLGTISILASKIIAKNSNQLGSSVGKVFALSTLSGIFGALLAGFYLATLIGSIRSFQIMSWILLILGIVGTMKRGKKQLLLLFILLLSALLASFSAKFRDAPLTGMKILEKRESFYGEILVTEDNFKRYLFVDRILQTEEPQLLDLFWEKGMFLSSGNYFEVIPYLNKDPGSCLIIGLGGGLLGKLFSFYDWRVEAVEIDPVVAEAAKTYFDYPRPVTISDGRYFSENTSSRDWDCIILDAFFGESIPTHLFTLEMFEICKRRLSSEGILALNVIGSIGSPLTGHLTHTLKQVFSDVAIFPERKDYEGVQFLYLFASKGHPDYPTRISLDNGETVLLQKPLRKISTDENSMIIRDERNPIDILRTETVRIWRMETWKRFEF